MSFPYVRVPECRNALIPIAGRTDPQGARTAPTKWTSTSVFPRFVGLTPTISVAYPSPELGYTQGFLMTSAQTTRFANAGELQHLEFANLVASDRIVLLQRPLLGRLGDCSGSIAAAAT